jgi:hypothetical protein
MFDTELTDKPIGTAIAATLIAAALADALIDKGVLSRDEVSTALNRAMNGLGTTAASTEGGHAFVIIGSIMRHIAKTG